MSQPTYHTILDDLLTPEDIARRITASSGVTIAPRTIWDKANRLGIAKKVGRTPLTSAKDIPALLKLEEKASRRETIRTGEQALKALKRARKMMQKARLEKMK